MRSFLITEQFLCLRQMGPPFLSIVDTTFTMVPIVKLSNISHLYRGIWFWLGDFWNFFNFILIMRTNVRFRQAWRTSSPESEPAMLDQIRMICAESNRCRSLAPFIR